MKWGLVLCPPSKTENYRHCKKNVDAAARRSMMNIYNLYMKITSKKQKLKEAVCPNCLLDVLTDDSYIHEVM